MKRNRIILAVIAVALLAGTWYAFEKIPGTLSPDNPIIMFISPHDDIAEEAAPVEKAAPEKKKEPEIIECKKAPEEAPIPVPEQKKPEIVWPAMGDQPVRQMINIMKEEFETTLGYRPDDLVTGKIIDNGTNRQRGEVQAIQVYVKYFIEQRSVKNYADEIKSNVIDRDLEKFWFSSGKKSLEEGVISLEKMADGITARKSKIPGDPKTLKGVLEVSRRLSAGEHASLTASDPQCMEKDNIFYHARGTAIVSRAVLSSSLEAFAFAASEKNIEADLEGAIYYLDKAIEMDPLIVLSSGPDSIFSNHLSTMAYYFDQSEDCIIRAINKL